jgi:SAM-dependent methyltransferase
MAARVDYESSARRYAQGRALTTDDLTHWREAVAGFVRPSIGTVVDLGAGTGIFTRAWAAWGAARVVAVEPSAAMRDQARRGDLPANAVMVAGRAEQLPLAPGSADVVWVSAVVHHLADLDAWAAETRRVLKAGGWLLIRGIFADLGTTAWLPELPGADRAGRYFLQCTRSRTGWRLRASNSLRPPRWRSRTSTEPLVRQQTGSRRCEPPTPSFLPFATKRSPKAWHASPGIRTTIRSARRCWVSRCSGRSPESQ